jgi:hypothetical protein
MTSAMGSGIQDLLAPKRSEILAIAKKHGAYNLTTAGLVYFRCPIVSSK